jgi:hypothetical protein
MVVSFSTPTTISALRQFRYLVARLKFKLSVYIYRGTH